jgi:hypothetical protein
VGLFIGEHTSFALQVHYGFPTTAVSSELEAWTDKSGVKLFFADENAYPSWHTPAVFLLIPGHFPGLPPKQALVHVRGRDKLPQDMVVFAVRTHAHDRGVENGVTVYDADESPIWEYARYVVFFSELLVYDILSLFLSITAQL